MECLYNPFLHRKPVAIGVDPKARHGIVLVKNHLAKACGVQPGHPLWMSKQLYPEIIFIPPHYDKYLRFSRIAREIYGEYTDQVEPFGLDEAWLDVTGNGIMGTGKQIANELRKRLRQELGITISVGVSFNKVFAKLGSDIKNGCYHNHHTGKLQRKGLAAIGQRPALCRACDNEKIERLCHPYDWRAGGGTG